MSPVAMESRRAGMRGTLATIPLLAAIAANVAVAAGAAGNVDAARLQKADSAPENWLTGGRDVGGSYFSPLSAIDSSNAARLGFAWQYDLGTPQRGQEATPLIIDGVMYTSGTWGYVYAIDAATGRERWRYDPKAEAFAARNPCCDLVNRGVAVWKGKVYVASVDGRLHAIDAGTGKDSVGRRHHHGSQAAVFEHGGAADRGQGDR